MFGLLLVLQKSCLQLGCFITFYLFFKSVFTLLLVKVYNIKVYNCQSCLNICLAIYPGFNKQSSRVCTYSTFPFTYSIKNPWGHMRTPKISKEVLSPKFFTLRVTFPCASCKISALRAVSPCRFYKMSALHAAFPCLFFFNRCI